MYINEGVQIAQRGALSAPDPVIASVPTFARDLFFPSEHRTDYYSGRFMGFFIQEPEQGRVVGQFPHLFPASIAIGYGLDGLTGPGGRPACGPSSACSRSISRVHGSSGAQPQELRPV